MNRHTLGSMMILVAAAGGLARTAHAGPPLLTDVVIPALTEQLRDGDASVRQAAIFALRFRQIGSEAALRGPQNGR